MGTWHHHHPPELEWVVVVACQSIVSHSIVILRPLGPARMHMFSRPRQRRPATTQIITFYGLGQALNSTHL